MLSSLESYVGTIFEQKHKTSYIFGEHHRKIIETLEKVISGEIRKLIINIAPRYGKTELAVIQFISWCFAVNPACKFIHLSYSASLTQDNSEAIKDIIKDDFYQAMFPYVKIKQGSDTKCKWNTTEGGGLYAVSTLGQITGFGAGATEKEEEDDALDELCPWYNQDLFAGAVIIDDPIKPQDALSDNIRRQVNLRFETTIRNRVNSRKTPMIIICQRTHEEDLCGYLMEIEPDDWTVISIPVVNYDKDGKPQALWPLKHTIEELDKIEQASPFVFQTQYMQNPTPKEGLLYTRQKTYYTLPISNTPPVMKNYTDTADEGSDFLCSIDYWEYGNGEMYVVDILYTQKPMEYTEVATAQMMDKDNVHLSNIESNNGGRGFARNVEKNLRTMGNRSTGVAWFNQGMNKASRIYSHSAEVMNLIYFPADWEKRWPQFAKAVKSYRKEGKNAHDDAPDVLTGMVEKLYPQSRGSRVSRT